MIGSQNEFWIVTGPQGVGKSTYAANIIGEFAALNKGPLEFVETDKITPVLNEQSFDLVMGRINSLRQAQQHILVETTVPGPDWQKMMSDFRADGYKTGVVAIGVASVDIAKANLARRAAKGDHYIPDSWTVATHTGCLIHTPKILSVADEAYLLDNSSDDFRKIASRTDDAGFTMHVAPADIARGKNPYIFAIVHDLASQRQLAPDRTNSSNLVQRAWLMNYAPKQAL